MNRCCNQFRPSEYKNKAALITEDIKEMQYGNR